MSKQLVEAKFEPSELKRRTRLLNSLIWLLMGTLGLFLVYVIALGLQSLTASLISLVGALLVSGIGYWFARSGKFYAAVYLFLSGFVILLLILVFLGGSTPFTISGEQGLGWGIVVIAIGVSFILACMSWLFGESINNAFSALRQRSEELQAANDKLIETQEQLIRSEKLAAIGQLASGVGHELRNPLGAIQNAVFYVRRRIANTDLPNTEPRVMEFLDLIDDQVNVATKVITDLLGFSRVAKPTVAPVSIAGVIEDALRHTPLPENVELIKEINNSLPMVMVDADQIRQVFLNIALNALQAMPESGRLDIRATDKGKFVEVEFTDTGGGIPEEIKKKIFDPLFTTKAKGVGLGLSVCKSILDRHQGDIRVESEVGKGATFTISLPTNRF
jgi:signal transduction histidine kinase